MTKAFVPYSVIALAVLLSGFALTRQLIKQPSVEQTISVNDYRTMSFPMTRGDRVVLNCSGSVSAPPAVGSTVTVICH